jgi:hypothetical protein
MEKGALVQGFVAVVRTDMIWILRFGRMLPWLQGIEVVDDQSRGAGVDGAATVVRGRLWLWGSRKRVWRMNAVKAATQNFRVSIFNSRQSHVFGTRGRDDTARCFVGALSFSY